MDVFYSILGSLGFWQVVVPASGAILAWIANERAKATERQLQRKEESYRALLASLRGFAVETEDPSKVEVFLDNMYLCWLYAPDEVVRAAYKFVETVGEHGFTFNDEDRRLRLGALVESIRNDMLSRKLAAKTKLKADEWKVLGTKSKNA